MAVRRPVETGGHGHGCGHNLLGAGAILAAVAVRDHLASQGLPGRVRYIGCPAEEGGSGKTFMARDGVFDGLDAAFTWHPGAFNGVIAANSLANIQAYFRFRGRAAHAASSPELGRSALDAVELMSVGVQYLREHMPEKARIHSAVLNTGGISPNVVQDFAEVLYLVRSPQLDSLQSLFDRVCKVTWGAAMMTETEVEIQVEKACSNLLPNRVLDRLMQQTIERLADSGFDEDDRAFAREIQGTLGAEDIPACYTMYGQSAPAAAPVLAEGVLPPPGEDAVLPGSTDVGDVSWQVPLSQLFAASHAVGTPMHSWQLVAQGKSGIAHRGIVFAAKAMAGAAVEVLTNPALLAEAKAEFADRVARTPYVCPIGPEVELPLPRG